VSDSARSPLSGCTILIAALVVMLFLIGFTIWMPFRQAAEIEKFTRDAPAPLPVAEVAEGEAAALNSRLERFGASLDEGEAELRLDADALNLAIAMFPVVEELRGTFRVREIGEESMTIEINYQLNGPPRLARDDEEGLIASDPRYLVGTIHGRPLLSGRELALRVDRLEVPDAEVPEGFMGHFSTLRLFESAREDPTLGPAMAKLTGARLEDGALVLARVPGESPPDTVGDDEFMASGGRMAIFLGGGMLVFLLLAGTVLFIGYRGRLRQIEAAEQTSGPDPDA